MNVTLCQIWREIERKPWSKAFYRLFFRCCVGIRIGHDLIVWKKNFVSKFEFDTQLGFTFIFFWNKPCCKSCKTGSAPRERPFRTSLLLALSNLEVWYSSGKTVKISSRATNRSSPLVPAYWKDLYLIKDAYRMLIQEGVVRKVIVLISWICEWLVL